MIHVQCASTIAKYRRTTVDTFVASTKHIKILEHEKLRLSRPCEATLAMISIHAAHVLDMGGNF